MQGVVFYSILARPLIPMLLFFIPMPAWVAGLVMLGMDYFGMQRQQSHVGAGRPPPGTDAVTHTPTDPRPSLPPCPRTRRPPRWRAHWRRILGGAGLAK